MKNLILMTLAFTLGGCAHHPVKPDIVEKPKQEEKKPPAPAPCSNFCRPIEPPAPPVITPYKSRMFIPMSRDPKNENAVSYVINRMKEKVTVTSIIIRAYTDPRINQKEAVALTQNKATSVKQALVASGVKPELITAMGMGHDPEPNKCKKNDNRCHQSNRNTEITIEGTTSSKDE